MKKLTQNEFIEKAMKIHNNEYDYSLVNFINTKTKVNIICKKHGIFNQNPKIHYNGSGCPKCINEKLSIKFRLDEDEFIEKANKIHNNKYNYNEINYVNAQKKIEIICLIHGKFYQNPSNHLNGSGCPKCAKDKLSKLFASSKNEFIEKAVNIHGNKYDYSLVDYINSMTKVCIICKKHGKFYQTPNSHTSRKQGCPICRESKGEKKLRKFFISNNIKFESQVKIKGCKYKSDLIFDYYLPEYKLYIEYDGIQHYKPIKGFGGEEELNKIKIRDNIKNKFIINNKLCLLRLPYTLDENNKLFETLNAILRL